MLECCQCNLKIKPISPLIFCQEQESSDSSQPVTPHHQQVIATDVHHTDQQPDVYPTVLNFRGGPANSSIGRVTQTDDISTQTGDISTVTDAFKTETADITIKTDDISTHLDDEIRTITDISSRTDDRRSLSPELREYETMDAKCVHRGLSEISEQIKESKPHTISSAALSVKEEITESQTPDSSYTADHTRDNIERTKASDTYPALGVVSASWQSASSSFRAEAFASIECDAARLADDEDITGNIVSSKPVSKILDVRPKIRPGLKRPVPAQSSHGHTTGISSHKLPTSQQSGSSKSRPLPSSKAKDGFPDFFQLSSNNTDPMTNLTAAGMSHFLGSGSVVDLVVLIKRLIHVAQLLGHTIWGKSRLCEPVETSVITTGLADPDFLGFPSGHLDLIKAVLPVSACQG